MSGSRPASLSGRTPRTAALVTVRGDGLDRDTDAARRPRRRRRRRRLGGAAAARPARLRRRLRRHRAARPRRHADADWRPRRRRAAPGQRRAVRRRLRQRGAARCRCPPARAGRSPGWPSTSPPGPRTALLDARAPGRATSCRRCGATGRAFAQATWRHLLFGAVLGELERRLNPPRERRAAPVDDDARRLQRPRLGRAPRRLRAGRGRRPELRARPHHRRRRLRRPPPRRRTARAAGDEVVGRSRAAGVRADLLDAAAAARRRSRDAAPGRRLPPRRAGPRRPLVGGPGRDAARQPGDGRSTCSRPCARRRRRRVVVAVSSGEVYGPPASLPVDEDAPLRPQNPYAVSKAATDLLAGFYADAHGLRVVRAARVQPRRPRASRRSTRSPSFARQVAAGLEAGDDPVRVVTGNPDVAPRLHRRARRRRAPTGCWPPPASRASYNVCSGRSRLGPRARRGARRGGRRRRSTTSSTRAACARTRSWRCAGLRPPRAGDGLGAADPAAADAGRHRGLVARGDPRRAGGRGCGGLSARLRL